VLGILGCSGSCCSSSRSGPLIAALGVLITALSVAGAFGIGRLIFQNGSSPARLISNPRLHRCLGAIVLRSHGLRVAMDYTLFMLSAAKERYETTRTPSTPCWVDAHVGRVVLSAAAVMIAVFLTFALSGPLAPKEMGVILAIAVALDALVVRLVLLP